MIKQLCYHSRIKPGAGGRVLSVFRDILKTSQRNNQAQGLSGYLLFDKTYFAQVLEGPAAKVDETFARIKADPRHSEVTPIGTRDRSSRQFGGWTMGGATLEVLQDREILLRHGLDIQGWQLKLDCRGLIDVALDFAHKHAANG